MKTALSLVVAVSLPELLLAQEEVPHSSNYGNPIDVQEGSAQDDHRSESGLDKEISAFQAEHKAATAALINNSTGRALNNDGRIIGSEALGRLVTPVEVIIIPEAWFPDSIAELYSSVKKLPDSAHLVRILYSVSPDRSETKLLGYTIESLDGIYTKLVKYDGKTPWLKWLTRSFQNDDAEQGGADQPATTAYRSEVEGGG